MESENLYPNDGSFIAGVPLEPLEQTIDRKKERAKSLEDLKILQQVIKRFNEQIIFLNSVDSMPDEVKTDPTKFMNIHNAHDLSIQFLRSELDYFESLLDNTGRREVI